MRPQRARTAGGPRAARPDRQTKRSGAPPPLRRSRRRKRPRWIAASPPTRSVPHPLSVSTTSGCLMASSCPVPISVSITDAWRASRRQGASRKEVSTRAETTDARFTPRQRRADDRQSPAAPPERPRHGDPGGRSRRAATCGRQWRRHGARQGASAAPAGGSRAWPSAGRRRAGPGSPRRAGRRCRMRRLRRAEALLVAWRRFAGAPSAAVRRGAAPPARRNGHAHRAGLGPRSCWR